MTDPIAWQRGDFGTLLEGAETQPRSICGGIDCYPLADEVPGAVDADFDRALDRPGE